MPPASPGNEAGVGLAPVTLSVKLDALALPPLSLMTFFVTIRIGAGFSVFVMNWGDAGFQAVEIGRKAAGRTTTDR